MAYTLQDLQALVNTRAQESAYREFKRGAALATTNEARVGLVKDCTALANADGGVII